MLYDEPARGEPDTAPLILDDWLTRDGGRVGAPLCAPYGSLLARSIWKAIVEEEQLAN
jgi:hypothetical protein